MDTKVINITPEMAANWLTMNTNNRKKDNNRINTYARAILAGRWVLTHQGIAFDEAGNLIDGQHRLEAIVKAGIPVEMNVTFGVKREEGEILEIDTGRVRTYNNIMQMSGQNDRIYLVMSGVVRSFMRYKVGNRHAARMPAYEVSEYIDAHYEELAYIAQCFHFTGTSTKNQGAHHASAFVAAAGLSALYGYENRDAIEKFGQVWCTNDTSCCAGYNTKIALDGKDRLRNMRMSRESFNLVENYIRCFAENKQVVRPYDCYPLDKRMAQ